MRTSALHHVPVWPLSFALLAGGCAKIIEGGCASDADCEPGVSCDLETNRCVPPPCHGASPGDDDPACGTIDCDGLDNVCLDFEDLTSGRCLGDGICKRANEPMTCGAPTELCAPYACDTAGPEPACRSSCDGNTDCSAGSSCLFGRCCRTGWEIHTIDSDGDVGQWGRIAVDQEGRAHGVWSDLTYGVVRVGENTVAAPGAWTVSSITDSLAVREDSSALALAVGSGGTIHVVHRIPPSGNVVHSYHDGSDWVRLGGVRPNEATLSASEVGMIHVLSGGALLNIDYDYAVVDGPSGACAPGWVGSRLETTTDVSGRAHATWWDIISLYYAYQGPSCDPSAPADLDCCEFTQVLAAATVDGVPDPGARHSIAYDEAAMEVHITYMAPSVSGLRHAICSEDSCSSEGIDERDDAGRFSSVVVGTGGLHVAYYDATTEDLRYATNAGGDWEHVAVDEDGNVGAFASLAYGPDGRLHALYYDADGKDARYATLSPDCVPGE